MAHRTFTDRDGLTWEVIARSKAEWEFSPARDNPEPPRTVRPPGYERDPFELSAEELQLLLDSSGPPRARPRKSPFVD